MTPEQVPISGRSVETTEHERLLHCFENGFCPYCGSTIDMIHANDHYGFCTEGHKYSYETEHSLDVTLDFKRAHGGHLHEQYLEDMAKEIGIPVELFRKLHNEEHKSPAEIRSEIEEYREHKTA